MASNIKTTNELVELCFNEIEKNGLCCLENALPKDLLDTCRAEVNKQIKIHGEKYFSLIQPYKESGSGFSALGNDMEFRSLLEKLCTRAAGYAASEGYDLYNVLRVIAGPNGKAESLKFHYDASVVTALVPLYIPPGLPHECGDLVVAANTRGIRKSSLLNVAEKIVIQNPLSYKIASKILLQDERTSESIRHLVPGNIYLFWGYRTLHANLPVASNMLRSTLIFHFGDPHKNSNLTKLILKIRKIRQKLEVRS